MNQTNDFDKGSKIIEDGKVYIIFRVESVKTNFGIEKILHYRPYFTTNFNSSVYCSMPQRNFASSNIRKPVTKDEVSDVLNYLTIEEDFNKTDLLEEANNFKLNSLSKTTRVLKLGLVNQKSKGKTFDISKNGIIKEAVCLMMEEVALVLDITLEKALGKIKQASKTYYSNL